MKVKIEFSVDIDVDAWCENYGMRKKDVRDDVKEYVQYGALEQLAHVGVLNQPDLMEYLS